MDLSKAIKAAEEAALKEIDKYDTPNPTHFEIANDQGQKLATLLNVDKQIVLLGTTLMDYKIGQAISENRLEDHIEMSRLSAEHLLASLDVTPEVLNKVLNCVSGHHKTGPWNWPEAEICANADCYRFLTPRGMISFLIQIGNREMTVDESIKYALSKIEEKWSILSIASCKQELEQNYHLLKQLLAANN